MKQQHSKKLLLNKKTVSVLQANEMVVVKGGGTIVTVITNPRSDSFIQCGSCFGACTSNGTNTTLQQTISIQL
jgi:hypothetical protein